ncbi:MAG: hypothetical protein KDI71_08045, partial [Xanthomonadales bacterium]|nr:hypothetical protein [Xanthomonadales bacterium]
LSSSWELPLRFHIGVRSIRRLIDMEIGVQDGGGDIADQPALRAPRSYTSALGVEQGTVSPKAMICSLWATHGALQPGLSPEIAPAASIGRVSGRRR